MKPYNAFGPTAKEAPQKGQKPTNKQKKAYQRRKLTAQLLSAVTLIIVGCGLLISGFIVPPMGEIHPSELIAFGEILTFVGALFGIDYHYKSKNLKP